MYIKTLAGLVFSTIGDISFQLFKSTMQSQWSAYFDNIFKITSLPMFLNCANTPQIRLACFVLYFKKRKKKKLV